MKTPRIAVFHYVMNKTLRRPLSESNDDTGEESMAFAAMNSELTDADLDIIVDAMKEVDADFWGTHPDALTKAPRQQVKEAILVLYRHGLESVTPLGKESFLP